MISPSHLLSLFEEMEDEEERIQALDLILSTFGSESVTWLTRLQFELRMLQQARATVMNMEWVDPEMVEDLSGMESATLEQIDLIETGKMPNERPQ